MRRHESYAGLDPFPLEGFRPGALSVTDTEPVNAPLALGLKVALIVQEAAGFRVAPQVFV